MRRRLFFEKIGATALLATLFKNEVFSNNQDMKNCSLQPGEIQHMVIFNLSYEKGSPKAMKFIQDATQILTQIPGVRNFQAVNQVSAKNNFQYGFSMVFDNQNDYSTYNNHPAHTSFVQERWLKEVTDFQETDFQV